MKFLLAALISLTASLSAAEPILGDAEAGRMMAVEICAECHNVILSPEIERANAPRSFTAIAKDRVYTPTSLRVFFATPHVQMPDFIFTRSQQDDLIAYLMTMRKELEAK